MISLKRVQINKKNIKPKGFLENTISQTNEVWCTHTLQCTDVNDRLLTCWPLLIDNVKNEAETSLWILKAKKKAYFNCVIYTNILNTDKIVKVFEKDNFAKLTNKSF